MEKPLCDINVERVNGLDLRTSGYVALSHVWVEGLQQDTVHQGFDGPKGGLDVLPFYNAEQSMLLGSGQIYSRVDAVLIIDALVLQLHPQNHVDLAFAIACGKWATRLWTYQEIKLASRALILTVTE